MKRLFSLIMIVIMLVTNLPFLEVEVTKEASGATIAYEQLKGFRITVDGKVYQADGYKGNEDKLYFTPSIVNQLVGKRPSPTTKINGILYVDLQSACNELGISSFEYDEVMNAAYIWTSLDNRYSDENRLKYYNLGTTSSESITYKEFFTMMDKAVQIADQTKLQTLKNTFKGAYSSNKTMTRIEGMMVILNVAVLLGSSYSEFNTNWSAIDESIGNKVWDEINFDPDFYEFIPYKDPYNLGGFQKDPYVYSWGYIGVAYRYGFGRASILNGKTLFDYDKGLNSMRPADLMTVSEALNAITRFLDSHQPEAKYISLTSSGATNYDKNAITEELLRESNKMPEVSDNNPPEWYGFVVPDGSYERTDIDELQIDKNFKRISDWGFNSARYMLTYQTLFDEGVTKVNETNLKKLDAVIASAMKYKLHLNIVTFSLPGRWTHTDFNTYTSTGSLDLFTNPARQIEANEVWGLISERYKNIPSSVLSFSPLWETQNFDLSSGLSVPSYTAVDVAGVYKGLISTIKSHDSDRYVVYEPTANNDVNTIINESRGIKDTIENNFKDTLMMTNFCECPFVYAEMTAIQGEHIDHNNHSMFKPEYPVTYYATQYHINRNEPLILRGSLVKDTTIDIYLSKVRGTGDLTIKADGEIISMKVDKGTPASSLALTDAIFSVGSPLSRYYLYAQSDKCISITLPKDVNQLEISYSGEWFEWSGIDVTLPQQYAVNRWWFMSHYDAAKQGIEWEEPSLKPTSRIMLSPNSYDKGREITIRSDISYTTSAIWAQSNQQTVFDWGAVLSQFAPHQLIRFESASFNVGTIYQSALQYYDDFMAMCNQYQFSWFSNDFNKIFSYSRDSMYAGGKGIPYQDGYILVDMLKVHQKYLPTPIPVKTTTDLEQMNDCTVSFDKTSYYYTGSNIIPQITVKNGLVILTKDTDYLVEFTDNIKPGTAKVTIKGKGNYTGTISKTFQINAKPVSEEITITLSQTVYTYTGAAIVPLVTVKHGTKILVEGADYTLSYTDNTKSGTAKVTITGKGNYAGAITKTFQINAKPVSEELMISLSQTAYTYTGAAIVPLVTVKYGTKVLVEGTDYTLGYTDNTKPGTAKVMVTGKGNYTGAITKTFQINAKPVSEELMISLSQTVYTYTGAAILPEITVKHGTMLLVKNIDYTVGYTNNTKPGTAKVMVTGKGNYTGAITKTFQINTKPVSEELMISLSQTVYTYTGIAILPEITVKHGLKVLVKNIDYTVGYTNNTKPGTAKVTITGKGNYSGRVVKNFRINAKLVSGMKLNGLQTTYRYNGSKITPALTLMDGAKKLIKNTDYTVTYTNNVNVGTATVIIQGKGNYTGSLKKVYQIIPGTPTLKLTSGSKKATISWSKVKGTNGYEVYLSTSKTGKYSLKKTTNALSYVQKSLISKKTYYIKIRAYTTIKGKKIYGSYSEVKSVKIK